MSDFFLYYAVLGERESHWITWDDFPAIWRKCDILKTGTYFGFTDRKIRISCLSLRTLRITFQRAWWSIFRIFMLSTADSFIYFFLSLRTRKIVSRSGPFTILRILGDPGATSRDDAIFSGERHFWRESLFQGQKLCKDRWEIIAAQRA